MAAKAAPPPPPRVCPSGTARRRHSGPRSFRPSTERNRNLTGENPDGWFSQLLGLAHGVPAEPKVHHQTAPEEAQVASDDPATHGDNPRCWPGLFQ
eukprot:5965198-Alexandrium_andersonii.AAC.1